MILKTSVARLSMGFFLLLWLFSPVFAEARPRAVQGKLDLQNWDFAQQKPVALNGEWEFHWQKLFSPGDFLPQKPAPDSTFSTIPSTWNSRANDYQNWGYASYRVRVLLAPQHPVLAIRMPTVAMSYVLYVNGVKVDQQGTVGNTRETTVSGWKPGVHILNIQDQVADIVIQVANFDDQSGGLFNAPYLGEAESLFRARNVSILLDILIFGALFMMGLYYLGLFLYRRRDLSSLYFSLLCIGLCLRQLCYGELVINDVLPGLPFIVVYRAGYILYCGALVAFVRFIKELFPHESRIVALLIIDVISGLYAVICLLAPPWVFASLLMYYQIFTMAAGAYIFIVLGRAIFGRRQAAYIFLVGFIFLFGTVIHDMLKGYFAWPTPDLTPYGLLIFLFAQSLILTRKFAGAFAATEKFADHLENLNQSLERFIPREVLAFLKKDSVIDIKLGDHIEREMTVMFADIRDFTSLSEAMTPRENFNFINSYLERMGPIIRKHQGFVDKYLGDGIMALFPGSPDQALDAALEMQTSIVEYNIHRASLGYRPVRVGFGIHAGNLMLGTIGESRRMDSTVISDTVNVASRLEGLTKKFNVTVMTSEAFIQGLEHPQRFEFRFLAEETVKGKSVPIKVFEVCLPLSGQPLNQK